MNRLIFLVLGFYSMARLELQATEKITQDLKPGVTYYYLDNVLTAEKSTNAIYLKLMYGTLWGAFLRPFFNRGLFNNLAYRYAHSALSKPKIASFIKEFSIDMSDYEKDAKDFKTFNDFFIRKLKQDARPIDQSAASIVSVADSKLLVIERLDENSSFFIKKVKLNLEQFVQNKMLAAEYKHGTLLIFRLAPYDYHRFHFPLDCTPSSARLIKGRYNSVDPLVYKKGFQPLLTNKRELIVLKSVTCGEVLMIPVGAMGVGKIEETYTPGKVYKKGAETGYFEFGGSTVVLLFKKDSIVVDQKFRDNSQKGFETAVKVGEVVAKCV